MTQIKEITFNSKTIKVELQSDADDSVFHEIFIDREYRYLEDHIKKAKNCILDLGGHKGYFTIYGRCLNPQVPIYTFEPEERNFQELKKNLKRNHIENVVVKQLAVAGTSGNTTLFVGEDSHNQSLIPFDNAEKQRAQSTTLEEIFEKLEKRGLSRCEVMKMDVEGSEFEIIEATPSEILKKVNSIYIEYHKYLPEFNELKIKSFLESVGFRVKVFPSSLDRRMGFIYAFQPAFL